jgi:succinate dehydrogenase hydrophobic anchor subunit
MNPQPDDEVIRNRQLERARVTAVLLVLFVVLLFAVTIAKMTINQ